MKAFSFQFSYEIGSATGRPRRHFTRGVVIADSENAAVVRVLKAHYRKGDINTRIEVRELAPDACVTFQTGTTSLVP